MSALGDALDTKNKEAVAVSKIEVFVDSATTEATVTYGVRLEAPAFNEIVLSGQTAQEVADALLEYQTWASGLWGL